MAWGEVSVMSQRMEFVRLAGQPGARFRELCRRFQVSPPTGYKWLQRYRAEGEQGLAERSRRPLHTPSRSSTEREAQVLALRDQFPDWGGRKLRALLLQGALPGEREGAPSASTITAILRRHGRLDPPLAGQPAAWRRFEHPAPNQLWQMDFKGHFALVDGKGTRCHPLTVLDDHSRFNVCLRACLDEREETVKAALTEVFRRYGLPLRITADNGSPWGNTHGEGVTSIGAWLIQLGVRLSHSRPYHPQTQGKDERFHRTFKAELLTRQSFDSIDASQRGFDCWREQYNEVRPHDALDLQTPISRYSASPRSFPETLPAIEYDQQDVVRKVQAKGEISFKGERYVISRGLSGLPVALRAIPGEEAWDVYFCHQNILRITPAKAGRSDARG